jgi:hypothetical protein
MSILTLLLRDGNYIDTIKIDAFLSESASASSRITSNPVENATDINDHKIVNPMTFTISGVVSNSSSNVLQTPEVVARAFANKTRAQEKWDALLELQASGKTFTLIQGLRSYENVTLKDITTSQDVNTANALFFTATLVELNFIDITAPPAVTYASADTSDKAVPTTNGGLKQLN